METQCFASVMRKNSHKGNTSERVSGEFQANFIVCYLSHKFSRDIYGFYMKLYMKTISDVKIT